jgi:tRNA pseudouridine38-40 synthase
MVATLIDVGRFKKSPDEVLKILVSKDRKLASETAPPNGLYLHTVHYDFSNLNPRNINWKKET